MRTYRKPSNMYSKNYRLMAVDTEEFIEALRTAAYVVVTCTVL